MRLLHLLDVVSNVETTVKVEKIKYPSGEVDVHIHQIEGMYRSVEEFNEAWDRDHDRNVLVNFICLDVLDGRKLVNALIEELR